MAKIAVETELFAGVSDTRMAELPDNPEDANLVPRVELVSEDRTVLHLVDPKTEIAKYQLDLELRVPPSSRLLLSLFRRMEEQALDPETGFHNNKAEIFDFWKEDAVFMLQAGETREAQFSGLNRHPCFVPPSESHDHYFLQALICMTGCGSPNCLILWVSRPLREHGIGSALVRLSETTSAFHVLPESERFWEKMGVDNLQ